MILDEDKIRYILKESEKEPEIISINRAYAKKSLALIEGKNFVDELIKIEGIEKNDKKYQARKKYSKSIKDVFHRILRPIDNVYSATGGSKELNLDESASDDEIIRIQKNISHVNGNDSIERYSEKNWIKKLHSEPASVFFIEYKAGEKDPYISFKSIFTIRNYEPRGQNLEWILFEPVRMKRDKIEKKYGVDVTMLEQEKDYDIYRLVDDANDYLFYKDNSEYYLLDVQSHPFFTCPGIIASDTTATGTELRLSPCDTIIEQAEVLLRDNSILTVYKFQNGFSLFVRPKMICPACHGTGKTGIDNCSSCDGKGFVIDRDVTDEIIIPINMDDPGNTINVSDFINYITPDLEIWNKYREEIDKIEADAYDTMWGISPEQQQTTQQTATEVIINQQSKINKLTGYSKMASYFEWQITEWIANYHIVNRDKTKRFSAIHYGNRYILESPDVIMTKYKEAVKDGLNVVICDRLLNEYITAKYKNDPESLEIELKKKKVTPYVHYTVKEVKEIFGELEARKKMLFNDWWEMLDQGEIQSSEWQQLQAKFESETEILINSKNYGQQSDGGGDPQTQGDEA